MILDQLSKKLGINLGYFVPRALWVGGRYLAMTLISLFISVAFARLTSKETFGQYQYVLSVVSLLSVFSLPGLNTAVLRAFVEGDQQSVARSVKISFIGSLFATVILVGLGVYHSIHSQPLLGFALGLSGLILPFFYAPNSWYVYYEGKLDFHSSTLRIIATNLVLLIGLVIGLLNGLNLVGLTTLYFGLNGFITILLFWEAKRKVRIQPSQNKLSLAYAIRCTIQKFTTTIGENVQMLAVSMIFGFANLAIYQVAQSFVNAFNGLTAALSATYFPLLLKYKRLNHGLILCQNIILGLAFWVIYLGAIKFLFTPLYGVKYQEAIELAYRLSFIIIIVPLRLYLTTFFSAGDQNRYIITTNLAASAIAILLFYLSRSMGFSQAATIYLYTLNLLMTAPLLLAYFNNTNYLTITPKLMGSEINEHNH